MLELRVKLIILKAAVMKFYIFQGGYNRTFSPVRPHLLCGCRSRQGDQSRQGKSCLLRPPCLLWHPIDKGGQSRQAEVDEGFSKLNISSTWVSSTLVPK